MIDMGPHVVFIVAAYLGVAVAVTGLVFWVLFDARRTTRALAKLEASAPPRAAQ